MLQHGCDRDQSQQIALRQGYHEYAIWAAVATTVLTMHCTQCTLNIVSLCVQVIGTISGSGKVVLKDAQAPLDAPTPVDLDLEKVLGDMPNKTYTYQRTEPQLQPLQLPSGNQTAMDALDRVLRLPAVHSKRFLTNKVDRCVTGELVCIPTTQCEQCAQQHIHCQ